MSFDRQPFSLRRLRSYIRKGVPSRKVVQAAQAVAAGAYPILIEDWRIIDAWDIEHQVNGFLHLPEDVRRDICIRVVAEGA